VGGIEPVVEQAFAGIGGADIATGAPIFDAFAQFGRQGRHKFVHAGIAQDLIGGEPAHDGIEDGIGRFRKIFM